MESEWNLSDKIGTPEFPNLDIYFLVDDVREFIKQVKANSIEVHDPKSSFIVISKAKFNKLAGEKLC